MNLRTGKGMFKIVPSKNLFSYLSLQKEVARISNYWRQKWGVGVKY